MQAILQLATDHGIRIPASMQIDRYSSPQIEVHRHRLHDKLQRLVNDQAPRVSTSSNGAERLVELLDRLMHEQKECQGAACSAQGAEARPSNKTS